MENNWGWWDNDDEKPSKNMPEGMPKDPHKKGCPLALLTGLVKLMAFLTRSK